jgi:Glycosyltransferase 61
MARDYRYKVSYTSLSFTPLLDQGSNLEIKSLNSVSIHNSIAAPDGAIDLVGNYFIFPDSENFYFHTLRDYVAQYELIKTYVPDIVPVVFCGCNLDYPDDRAKSCLGSNPVSSPEKFIREIYKNDLVIIDWSTVNSVHLENLHFIYLTGPAELDQLVEIYGYDSTVLDTGNAYLMEDFFAETLRAKFIDHIKETNADKKIYVSRLKESKATWKLTDAWDAYAKTGEVPTNSEMAVAVANIAKSLPESLNELEMKKARAFSLSDEEKLEKYFQDNGYQVISPGDFSVQEQIELFSSSSYIAGAGGSGMTNTLFCNPDAKIILISAGNRFNFGGHGPLAKALGKKCEFFPAMVTVDHSKGEYVRFSADEILAEICASRI